MRAYILLSLIISTAIAVPTVPSSRLVIGGENTSIERYPFFANIQLRLFQLLLLHCAGSLLTPDAVLTAAQCFSLKNPSSYRLRLGSPMASYGGDSHDVSEIIIHEDFNEGSLAHDVAILRLASSAQESATIGYARIPSRSYSLPDNTPVSVVNFGQYAGLDPSFPVIVIHKADVFTINQQTCVDRYAVLNNQTGADTTRDVTDGMICSGVLDVGGQDVCMSGEGSPLVYGENIVVGVISWVHRCGDAHYPRVNTRVAAYSDWIVGKVV